MKKTEYPRGTIATFGNIALTSDRAISRGLPRYDTVSKRIYKKPFNKLTRHQKADVGEIRDLPLTQYRPTEETLRRGEWEIVHRKWDQKSRSWVTVLD